MKDLESVDPSDPRFDELLAHLTSTIRHHVQDEENDLFPGCAPPRLARSWSSWPGR